MDTETSSVTAERKVKRQKRCILSPSQSTVVPSTPFSTSGAVSLTLPSSSITSSLGRSITSPKGSNQVEMNMASTPIDPHNLRVIRSKACFDL